MEKSLINLGKCIKPHGVKGGMVFDLINRESSILRSGFRIKLHPKSDGSSISSDGLEQVIRSISFGNKVIVYLEGINSRNEIEELIPFEVCVERKDFPNLPDDEYYLSDLIGFYVYDKNGEQIGEVLSIGSNGVQNILNVGKKGEKDFFEILIIDNFIHNIDFLRKKIIASRPNYL